MRLMKLGLNPLFLPLYSTQIKEISAFIRSLQRSPLNALPAALWR
jgi:hypothetical protein